MDKNKAQRERDESRRLKEESRARAAAKLEETRAEIEAAHARERAELEASGLLKHESPPALEDGQELTKDGKIRWTTHRVQVPGFPPVGYQTGEIVGEPDPVEEPLEPYQTPGVDFASDNVMAALIDNEEPTPGRKVSFSGRARATGNTRRSQIRAPSPEVLHTRVRVKWGLVDRLKIALFGESLIEVQTKIDRVAVVQDTRSRASAPLPRALAALRARFQPQGWEHDGG